MEKFLLYEQNKAIVTLTMNQPEVRNALTGNTAVEEFVQACARISIGSVGARRHPHRRRTDFLLRRERQGHEAVLRGGREPGEDP